MKISIIIPVRNMADTLSRAIKSVENQTDKAYEIIVVDDKSDDGSGDIAALHKVKIIRNNTENFWGPAEARNKALFASEGDVIIPLDADDWIEPSFIEKTIQHLSVGYVGIVSTDMRYFGFKRGIISASIQTYELELQANNIPVTSAISRNAILQAGLWDSDLKGWEDWDLWLRILALGYKHRVVNEPLFNYYASDGGVNFWAGQHKDLLRQRMGKKHPKFLELRQASEAWNGI